MKVAAGMSPVSVLDTDYTDDMGLIDNTKDGRQETTDLLSYYSAFTGLQIKVQKTKDMATGNQHLKDHILKMIVLM